MFQVGGLPVEGGLGGFSACRGAPWALTGDWASYGDFLFPKHRFLETMFPALSMVGFAPLGSYYSPLGLKPSFWTS